MLRYMLIACLVLSISVCVCVYVCVFVCSKCCHVCPYLDLVLTFHTCILNVLLSNLGRYTDCLGGNTPFISDSRHFKISSKNLRVEKSVLGEVSTGLSSLITSCHSLPT